MFLDAHSVPAGTVVEADLCIVGSGAAGITIAREFANSNVRVVLLDSGSMEFDSPTQDLYAGSSVGRPYLDLTSCRLRFFGGTTNHWGGWCMPLDPIDFEEREGLPHRGWPFDRSHLDPWYRRAHEVLQLGPYDYRPSNWGIRSEGIPEPFKGPHFICKMLQNSPPTRFGSFYAPQLRQAEPIAVYLNANALRFETDDANSEIRDVSVGTLAGARFAVKARHFVLACGGIENARLLLASGNQGGLGLGNERDLVGRFFMVHLEYSGGTVAVSDPYTDFDFYTNVTSNGRMYDPFRQKFSSFVGLSENSLRSLELPNVKVMWKYEYGPEIGTAEALQRLFHGTAPRPIDDLRSVIRDLGGAGNFLTRKAFSRPAVPVDALQLRMSQEPAPNPDSRIRLGDERDALGMRRVVVDWRLAPEDRTRALALQRLLGTEIGRTGFGRLRPSMTEDGESWPDDMYGDEHHMGTTRMHRDPAQGVVDENCRLHGVANLYVAGSSIFPTAGVSNPTMTITALALRLADHIKGKIA